ncbi:hypothetical protein [Herbidospora daliensis]|uniref:hypothetical protein n=1 Tax=Herbidospora daliensis TaxID=295585 RepID=UPI000784558E|nr:hypothetical protein [Herbidospora daliensis]
MEFANDPLGIEPIPWQRWLLIHAHELRPDGKFRFRTVLVLVARQNGKTTIVEVKNLWKMFILGVGLVLGTAQNLDYSEESWGNAVDLVEATPELAAEVVHVDRTNGKKALRLANGSRWKVAAASRKGGRSLSADDVNLDELREHQTWDAWAAVTKTTIARKQAQIWAFTNAGDDKSVVLNDLVEKGREAVESGGDGSFGHFEWSAPDDVKCTCGRPGKRHTVRCRLQDRTAWALANPSLGYTVTEEALADALDTDPEGVFRTECLCQKVDKLAPEWSVIPQDDWTAIIDPESELVDPIAIALDVTPDRSWGSIAAAGRRADGLEHVEVIDHRAGTGWMVARTLTLIERWGPCAVVVDGAGPAGSLIPDLEAAGIEVVKPTARDHAQACGSLYDAVVPPKDAPEDWRSTLRHLDQAPLNAALAGATKRDLSDLWAWARRGVSVDISPVVAVTLARWGFQTRGHLKKGPIKLVGSLMA